MTARLILSTLLSAVELSETLRKAILRGDLVPGDSLPSERQLCEDCGLSRMTVRRGIQTLIDEGLLYRVAGTGTFVGKRNDAPVQVATLGLIVPSLANAFYAEFADVIAQEAYRCGMQLMLGRSEFNWVNEADLLRQYSENPGVKGILVAPTSGLVRNAESYRQLRDRGIPYLYIVRKPEEIDGDSVMTDHVGGAAMVVRYLIELGHRQIAYVGALRSEPNRHLQGYRQALQEAGIPEDPELIFSIDAGAEEAGREGTRLLLESGKPFTAIFARIDNSAVGVLQTLRQFGKRVPEEVSLASFDNTEVGKHLQPPLTSVDHTVSELGRLAVMLLMDRIENRYSGPARRVVISPTLIVRESSAPPRSS